MLEQQGLTTAGPITAGIRAIKGAITGIKGGVRPGMPIGPNLPLVDFSQVKKIYNKLGDEYTGVLKTKADVVKDIIIFNQT